MEGKYRIDVQPGGDYNHFLGHAHIYESGEKIASIDEHGNVLSGKLSRGARKFVKAHLELIRKAIYKYYYLKG